MSLKDDFFEALRSVKRDFFKEYDSEEDVRQPAPTFLQPDSSETVAPTAMSNEEIGEIIRETASVPPEKRESALHTPPIELELTEDDDEEQIPPDVDATPYRMQEDDSSDNLPSAVAEFLSSGDAYTSAGDASGDGTPPSGGDGRIIFDNFDSGDSPNDERTIISKNTVIRGALQTEDSVRMFGQILGDIDCKSNVLVAGKVRGNTSAANAYIVNAQVDGNLLCDDVINVSDDAWILGNIRAQQADIDGKIKGNIEIRHTISIGSNSSIIGNISTDELEIKRGAFVNGQVMMYSPSRDVIDRFDRFDQ